MRPFWLSTLHMFLYTFSPAVFIHMAMSFPEERMLIKKHPYTQLIPYLPSTILFAFMRAITPEMWNLPKMWRIIAVAYMVLAILIYLGSCLQLWLTSQSEIVKVRAKMILLGVTLTASIPLFENLMNAIFGIFIVPSINYYLPFLIIFPLSLGFSILKYNLFDFDAIIRRSFGYILLTGGISAIYALSLYLFNLVFGRFEIAESPLFPLLFVLAVVFLFNPVRNQAQKFIDRVFFRLEYDYQEVIHKISETMRSLLSLDQIGKYIMDTALGTMFIDSGRLMLLNPQEQVFECLTTKDKEPAFFDAKSPIINQVAESRANHPEQVRDRKVGLKSLVTANKGWVDQYGFAINIGIGINTGEVFLGNIGSPERMEFTVIGDPVNIASRFSGMARPGQILVTKETLKCLDSEIAYRELPPMEVKGKTGKLEVFEMIYS